jgi:hypothetical protein
MMKKIIIPIMAGALLITTAIPFVVQAGKGGGGAMGGNSSQTAIQDRDRLRLRDGSCLNSNKNQASSGLKKGNTYGPGDGRGNAGVGPKDGTGYGAPSQR